MPRLKRLSASDVLKILAKFCFTIHSQRGSHIKLRRTTIEGKQTFPAVAVKRGLKVFILIRIC